MIQDVQDVKEIIPRILRDMSDGVLVLDRQGQILFLNEQGQKMLGENQDVTGQNYAAGYGNSLYCYQLAVSGRMEDRRCMWKTESRL